jgi:hypothetical protein
VAGVVGARTRERSNSRSSRDGGCVAGSMIGVVIGKCADSWCSRGGPNPRVAAGTEFSVGGCGRAEKSWECGANCVGGGEWECRKMGERMRGSKECVSMLQGERRKGEGMCVREKRGEMEVGFAMLQII